MKCHLTGNFVRPKNEVEAKEFKQVIEEIKVFAEVNNVRERERNYVVICV